MQEWMIFWGPIVSGTIAGIFTLIGAYLQISRPEKPRPIIGLLSLMFLVIGSCIVWLLWEPKSVWDIWSDKIKNSIASCTVNGGSDVYCVESSLDQHVKLMPPVNDFNNVAANFYHDIKAGEIIMNINEVREVFKKYFGINPDTFIGSGSTVPWDSEYRNAQAREYLIPNYRETHKSVWTWKISPEQIEARGMTIKELIETVPPDPNSNSVIDIALAKKTLYDTLYNSKQPPVIRSQQFSEKKYKGTIGRPEALRVFAISLADVINIPFEEAIRVSGFTWNSKNIEYTDTKLFVWISIPFHHEEVVPATWGNIIRKASIWLKEGRDTN